jgi:hypothetical protein
MNIVLHIDVAKVNGDYTNVIAQKYEMSIDGPEEPKTPLRIEEETYGSVPHTRMAYIPVYDESIEKVFGPDWKQLDFIVDCCPNGSITSGDLDDPDSEVSKIKAKGDFETLPAKYGASAPNVFYSNLPKRQICGAVILEGGQSAEAAGVEISLEGSNTQLSTTADGFGDFKFDGLNFDNSYAVSVSSTGFATQEFSIDAGSENVSLGEIVLKPE